MIEYEHSFKVMNIAPFIDYCESKEFVREKKVSQTRVLYTNDDKVLARITTDELEGIETKYLDFKEENQSDEILKISEETSTLKIDNNSKEFVESVLDFFKFKQSKELKRIRYIYKRDNVKFEIDEYLQPEMKVVAIEGEKSEVDEVYKEIEELYKKYKS